MFGHTGAWNAMVALLPPLCRCPITFTWLVFPCCDGGKEYLARDRHDPIMWPSLSRQLLLHSCARR